MSHVRQQIRDAVAVALEPLGGVHKSRLYPVQPEELPVFLVYLGDESIEGDLTTMSRQLEVTVEIVAAGDDYDDQLESQLVDVEQALTGDLNGLVQAFTPTRIELTSSVEGAKPIGRSRVTFEALYRTSYTDPETSI
jgi:hypothetical protein